jgi:hypothetical protein
VPINYETESCTYGFKVEDDEQLKIFIENYDGSLSDVDAQSDVSLDMGIAGSSRRLIHVEAWIIPIDIQYFPNEINDWSWSSRVHHFNGNVSGYVAVFQDDEKTLRIPLFSLYQPHDKRYATQQGCAPNFQRGSLLGIVLGRCESLTSSTHHDDIFVMIVHEEEHHYGRVGHMVIKYTAYQTINSKGPNTFVIPWPLCFRLKKRRTIRLG